MPDAQDDLKLLEQFAADRSELAFGELVRRHVNLVYSAALRQVRDRHLAEDITQIVFATLAQKASKLKHQAVLPAWLLTTTRLVCLDLLRRQHRRDARERKASSMREQISQSSDESEWSELEPLLDGGLASLSEIDRKILVSKYFAGRSDEEAAASLGMNENTLRQRRFRSLQKLRAYFQRRGVSVSGESLASAMLANAVRSAPAHLAVSATQHAMSVASGSAATYMASWWVKGILMSGWIKSNAAVLAVIALLVVGGTGLLATNYFRNSSSRVVNVPDQQGRLEQEPRPHALHYAMGERIPARGYSVKQGAQDFPGGMGYLDTDAWLKYPNVDFGSGAATFTASVAVPAENAGKDIVVRVDNPHGPEIARLTVKSTGGWGKLQAQETQVSAVTGVHDVFLTFTGSGVANLYWIRFGMPQAATGVSSNGAGIASELAHATTQPVTRPSVSMSTTQPTTRPTTQPD